MLVLANCDRSIENPSTIESDNLAWLAGCCCRPINSAQTTTDGRYAYKPKSVIACKHRWCVCRRVDIQITWEIIIIFSRVFSLSLVLDESMQLCRNSDSEDVVMSVDNLAMQTKCKCRFCCLHSKMTSFFFLPNISPFSKRERHTIVFSAMISSVAQRKKERTKCHFVCGVVQTFEKHRNGTEKKTQANFPKIVLIYIECDLNAPSVYRSICLPQCPRR